MLSQKAEQEVLSSRGVLDPSINAKFYHKEFQSKEYYTLWDNYLKVPTWYGIDLKAGYERNSGPYVNGEHITPLDGLSYIGVSVPVGQGLFIDERRSQIKQAKQLILISQAERIKVINKLLLQASKDYWDWMYSYYKQNFYKKGLELSTFRSRAVKERVKLGDLSAIDTVEAMMQVQNFQLLFTQAEVEYKNSSLILSNYLWYDDGAPVEISGQLIPADNGAQKLSLSADSIKVLVSYARSNHPEIIKLKAKQVQYDIQKRYFADKFKPKLNLEFNLLQTSFPANENILHRNTFNNNFKLGGSFSYPLFLRSERGKYQLTKLKQKETDFEIQQTLREIENSIFTSINDLEALEKQLAIQENMVSNADQLRAGELARFENGESSIFLINTRESYLITNQVKLYELKAKYAKAKVAVGWNAGLLQ